MENKKHRTFPDKISSHSFHIALYSSWLWWRGPELSLLLKIAYSKQNGECPTLKHCQETTKHNKQHIMFFWSSQWFQDLLDCSWVSWIAGLKKLRGKNEVVICLYFAFQLGKLSEKVKGLHTNRGWKFWQRPTTFLALIECFGGGGGGVFAWGVIRCYGSSLFPKTLYTLWVPLWAYVYMILP